MPGIVDPAFWGHKSGDNLFVRINGYRSFQEMFSEFPGSFRKIMAAISARKSRRIYSGYGNIFIGGVEQVHGLSEGDPKIKRFYPERSEMGYYWEIQNLLNTHHISDIFDEFPVVLVTEILEQNQDEQLMLGIDLLWKFTGIRIEMSWLYDWNGCLDKPDIPARWFLNCLLSFWLHNQEKETSYLRSFGRRYNTLLD